ncbi:BUD13 homolog [Thrips palmi]|uniref:BUD13 homolog n=1 Tax=Thrips palmi TaxID=161013 RepID=A0A6P8Z5V4_THRPL|nr:BUD13 homolog [Thrips palmi]
MSSSATKLSQKDYLKKYLSGGAEGKKKKKKKPKSGEAVLRPKVKVIDDDVDLSKLQALDDAALDLYELTEDAPQVVGIVDERPAEVKALEQYKQVQRWKVLSNSDGDGVSVSAVGGPKQASSDEEEEFSVRPQADDQRKSKSSKDSSPPRRKRYESDESPPRRGKRNDSDDSPPRKKKNYDSDASPPRKKNQDDSDASPPRRKMQRDSDAASSRKGQRYDSDESPPRNKRQQRDDSDSLRRKQSDKSTSSKHQQADSDSSPPRKRQQDDSYARKKGKQYDVDQSPPRRKKQNDSDTSPPRRKQYDSDTSPPRKRQPDHSERTRRKNQSDSDTSPPRRSSKRDSQDSSVSRHKIKQEKDDHGVQDSKMKKTLDGKKAGLQDAKHLKQELLEFRQREEKVFAKMDDSLSGRGAVAVQRDRKTGLKRDMEREQAEQRVKDEQENKHKEKYTRWGKGVKQTEDQQVRLQNDLYEMSKPLARYADDADLDSYLKDQDREGDPMLEYLQNKKKEQSKNKVPVYQGSFPPNRYNIRPGYRWDGVDRSCGYERKWFEAKNAKKAVEEEAYKWSTSDM